MSEMFQSKVFIFVTNSKSDFEEWRKALSSYVISSKKVVDTYKIIDKLGRGSFGYVVLATEIKISVYEEEKVL